MCLNVSIQYLCNLCKYNVLLFINIVLLVSYLFTYLFVHRCNLRICTLCCMYNVCLHHIHCLCDMSYLVKPES